MSTTKEEVLEIKFFQFNIHAEIHTLQQFSSTDMNDGEAAMLARYGFEQLPGETSPITYYSSNFAQARFLAIAKIGGYRLIVFIQDDASLLAWRQKYGFAGSLLPDMLMPHVEPPNNFTPIKMNTRVLRGN